MSYTWFAHIPSVAEEHNVKESYSRPRKQQIFWHSLTSSRGYPEVTLEYLSFGLIIILNLCLFFDNLISLTIFWSYSTQITFFYLPPFPLNPLFFPSTPRFTFMCFALWPTEIHWGSLHDHKWRDYTLEHGQLTTGYVTAKNWFQFTSNHWLSSGRVELPTHA